MTGLGKESQKNSSWVTGSASNAMLNPQSGGAPAGLENVQPGKWKARML
jgi:hypothetical protein